MSGVSEDGETQRRAAQELQAKLFGDIVGARCSCMLCVCTHSISLSLAGDIKPPWRSICCKWKLPVFNGTAMGLLSSSDGRSGASLLRQARQPLAGPRDRVCTTMAGALSVNLAALGDKMGIFKAMKDGGPMTSAQLADKMGLSERFLREWLYQQVTTSGLLGVNPGTRARY